MTESIQLEAVRLDLEKAGFDFDTYYRRTSSFVKGIIGKPWWADRKQLLTNEGPLHKMVVHCLIYIIEKGDKLEGYKAYTSYLTSEYGTSQHRNTMVDPLDPVGIGNMVSPQQYRTVRATGDLSVGQSTSVEPDVHYSTPSFMTDEEAAFMVAYSKMGMPETAEAYGLTLEEGWKRYRNLRQKVRYREKTNQLALPFSTA